MGRDLGACQIIELLDVTISFKTNPEYYLYGQANK
jgi:hypothetical protein